VTTRAKDLTLGCSFALSSALSRTNPGKTLPKALDLTLPSFKMRRCRNSCPRLWKQRAGTVTRNTLAMRSTVIWPRSRMIDYFVREGREGLDMSRRHLYTIKDRISALTRLTSEVRAGQMPPRSCVLLHPQARLSSTEQRFIYGWAKSDRNGLRHAPAVSSYQSLVDARVQKP
jgi:Haem-binding domain